MKEKITVSLEEQEFVINYYPVEDGSDCQVYTTIPWAMKYLEKLVEKYPEQCKVISDDQYSYTVKMPFKLCKPRAPRLMTDEQKAVAAERLAELRNRKNAG